MIQEQVIWNNRCITISKHHFYWKRTATNGIIFIEDLLGNNNKFMGHTEINNKYDIKSNFFDILQIRQSIPFAWRNILNNSSKQISIGTNTPFIDDKMYTSLTLTTKVICNSLVANKCRYSACITKWSKDYPGFQSAHKELLSNIFKTPYTITREPNLQSFKYKIIHQLITYPKRLFDLKLVDNAKCKYSHELDNTSHFFLFCPIEDQFWRSFFTWWNNLGNIQIPLYSESLEECILFGFQTEGDILSVLNYCILIAKFHIYCQWINNNNAINLFQYLIELKNKPKIENYICASKSSIGKIEKFLFLCEQL